MNDTYLAEVATEAAISLRRHEAAATSLRFANKLEMPCVIARVARANPIYVTDADEKAAQDVCDLVMMKVGENTHLFSRHDDVEAALRSEDMPGFAEFYITAVAKIYAEIFACL